MRFFWPFDTYNEVKNGEKIEEFVVKIINVPDSRNDAAGFLEATKVEIDDIKKRDT